MTLNQIYKKMQVVYNTEEKLGRIACNIDSKSNNDLFTTYEVKGIDILDALDSIKFLLDMVDDVDVTRG